MLDFRLRPRLQYPAGRQPRLNLAHPLISQQSVLFAGVAEGKGFRDLVSNVYATNTNVIGGVDENGPWAGSSTASGTGQISFAAPSISYQYMTWGIIFKWTITAVSTMLPLSFGSPANNGILVIATSGIIFDVSGGTVFNIPVGLGNGTYFCFMNNAVGTATQTRTCTICNLLTGQIWIGRSASSANLVPAPSFNLFTPSSNVSSLKLYAAFATGSVLVPPAVTPAAFFYSIDQIMSALADPWGLWYA